MVSGLQPPLSVMMTTRTRVLALAALAGCSPAVSDPAEQPDADASLSGIQTDFGAEGKADLGAARVCDVLRPLRRLGDRALHAAFFAGVEGDLAAGVASASSGYDVVFDLYHHQVSVSRYSGVGVRTPALGGSLTGYVGMALGLEHGVTDWDGYFVGTSAEISLPVLKDLVSLQPAFFVTGVDRDGDHVIAPSEVLPPPQGVYGGLVGVSVGFDLLPSGLLPVGGGVSQGLWAPHRAGIRALYQRLAAMRFARIGGPLAVRLVNPETGETCPASWPIGSDEECVLELGPAGGKHAVRGVHQDVRARRQLRGPAGVARERDGHRRRRAARRRRLLRPAVSRRGRGRRERGVRVMHLRRRRQGVRRSLRRRRLPGLRGGRRRHRLPSALRRLRSPRCVLPRCGPDLSGARSYD